MFPTVQAAQQVSYQIFPASFLRVVATTRSRNIKLVAAASCSGYGIHVCFRNKTSTRKSTTFSSTHSNRSSCEIAPLSKMLILRTVLKQDHLHMFSQQMRFLSCSGAAAVTRARGLYSSRAAPVGYSRAFGGQSVVPWELALFLVEEVR